MTGIRKELTDILSRFDDDAFAALANRGLVRRAYKDLEKQAATVLEETSDTVVVVVGDNRIRFDGRGPAHAACSCTAGNICQHILAAAIALKRLGAPGDAGENISPGATTPGLAGEEESPAECGTPETKGAGMDVLRTRLLGMTMQEMSAHCGKAGYRWACQYVQDLEIEQEIMIGGEQQIMIGLRRPRLTFRYMGGSLANLIADGSIPNIEKYAVAAVLAYQKANGAMMCVPDPAGKATAPALNLGREFAEPGSVTASRHDSRQRLRSTLRQILAECLEIGLSHLSRGMFERFTTLSVWAQGAEYHRLARLLHRVSDQIEMLLERAGSADEHLLLDDLTLVYGLVAALDAASERDRAPVHLVGKARGSYSTSGQLELLGLGACAWRAQSGYVGLTVLFWSTSENSFLTYGDARPEIQSRGFNPFTRYSAPGPWSGLASPAATTGCRIVLTNARISETGRLSGSDNSCATSLTQCTSDEIISHLNPYDNWLDLFQARHLSRRSLLAEPEPMKDWVALKPVKFGKPHFDGNRQTLVWQLFDEREERIDAELLFSEYTRHAITRIEHLSDSIEPGTVVIGRIRNGFSGMVLEPLSLVNSTAIGARNAVDALYFDDGPEKAGPSKNLVYPKCCESMDDTIPSMVILPSALLEMGNRLRRMSERGTSCGTADAFLQELRAQCEKAGRAGFTAFGQLVCTSGAAPELLLRANYLRLQYERLLDVSQEPVFRD